MFKTKQSNNTKLPRFESLLPTFALHRECEEDNVVKRRVLDDVEKLLALPYNWPVALYQPILIPVIGLSPQLMDEKDEDDAAEVAENEDDVADVMEGEDDAEALEKKTDLMEDEEDVTPREPMRVVETSLKRKLPREFMLIDENHPKRIKLDRGKLT